MYPRTNAKPFRDQHRNHFLETVGVMVVVVVAAWWCDQDMGAPSECRRQGRAQEKEKKKKRKSAQNETQRPFLDMRRKDKKEQQMAATPTQ